MPGVDPRERPTIVGGEAPPLPAYPERGGLDGDTLVGGRPPGPPPPLEPPPPPDGRRLDRALAIGLLVLLVLVAGGIALAVLLTRNGDHKKNAQAQQTTRSGVTVPPLTGTTPANTGVRTRAVVAVPRVVGQREAAAKARLRAQGLGSNVQPRAGARKGFVVDQVPPVGSELRRGSAITLVVGTGLRGAGSGAATARVAVPGVVGLTEDQASTRLQAAKLPSRTRKAASSRPAGTVLSQTPGAGSRVKRGTPVVLTVAQAPPKATVPDVVGQQRLAAIAALRRAHLGWRQHTVPSQEQPGTVIAQFPQAGTVVPRGRPVRLNIAVKRAGSGSGGTSTSPAVPDVTSEDVQTAIADLKAAGFHARSTPESVTDQSQDGIVLDQDPAAGTRAQKGTTVTLTVGRYSG